jgi:hypothetical protein
LEKYGDDGDDDDDDEVDDDGKQKAWPHAK